MKHLIFLLTIFLVFSCNPKKNTKIKEGTIEYDIIYLNQEKESLYSFMLPKTMTVSFNKNSVKNYLSGFSGNFEFSTITYNRSDSAIALFQIMNQKYYYIDTEKGPSDLFGALPKTEFVETKDTGNIAGFGCYKTIVESLVDSISSFNVFSTDKIKIQHPNKKNPYHKINNVLLDFQLNLCNMDMRFVAKNITEKVVHDSVFSIPEDYKRINRETVDKIFLMLE